MASVPQRIASQTVASIASREKWDATPVLAAIETADPDGVDWFATDPEWWQAVAVALAPFRTLPGMEVLVRTAENGGRNAEKMGALDVVAGTVVQTAQDAKETGKKVGELASSPLPYLVFGGFVLWVLSR